MPTVHSFDLLPQAPDWRNHPMIVLFGDESFLRQRILHAIIEDYEQEVGFPASSFDGQTVEWPDVADEIATVSLFGGSTRRVAIVDDADRFVTTQRDRLEDLAERPPTHGCLVLLAQKWLPNTRLYKRIDKVGLQVECRAPLKPGRRSKEIDEPRILKWMIGWAKKEHQIGLSETAARELLETVGPKLGLIDQDFAKLALYVKLDELVTEKHVKQIVGGWRQQTVWEIIDAGLDGDVVGAIAQLDHLLQAGEAPQAIFAQISWALRRFAYVTDLYLREDRNRQKPVFSTLMKQAGFRDWPAGSLKVNENRLRRLGRERAANLHRWLLATDLALKGTHSSPGRARFALESLFIRLNRLPKLETTTDATPS